MIDIGVCDVPSLLDLEIPDGRGYVLLMSLFHKMADPSPAVK